MQQFSALSRLSGTVIKVDAVSADIEIDGRSKDQVIGRLYKRDSLADTADAPMDALPQYALGQRIGALVNNSNTERHPQVVFLHERWAENGANPWQRLRLKKGDVVNGTISNAIPDWPVPEGYLVQLDRNAYPDIKVMVKIGDIPKRGAQPIALGLGDPISAVISDADRHPPLNPLASIRSRRDYWLTQAVTEMRRVGVVHQFSQSPSSALEADKAEDEGAQVLAKLHGKSVFLIDDESAAIESFSAAAQLAGMRVGTYRYPARNGASDLIVLTKIDAYAKEAAIDVVLIDDSLGRPVLGLQLLLRLQKQRTELRFVLVSSFLTTESERILASEPELAFIQKPIQPLLLAAVLDGDCPREFDPDALGQQQADDVVGLCQELEDAITPLIDSDNKLDLVPFYQDDSEGWKQLLPPPGAAAIDHLEQCVHDAYMSALFSADVECLPVVRGDAAVAPQLLPLGWQWSYWQRVEVEGEVLIIALRFKNDPKLAPATLSYFATQLARRLWSQRWREAIVPILAVGQNAAAIAHELVSLNMHAKASLDQAHQHRENDAQHAASIATARQHIELAADSYAALLGRTAKTDSWSLAEATQNVINLLKPWYDQQGITVESQVGSSSLSCPSPVYQMILQNLLSNAIKHHFSSADEVGKSRQVLITSLAGSEYVEIHVADNGPGIALKNQARLYRLQSSMMHEDVGDSHHAQGHGIGLWLCKKLLSRYGGEIELESYRGVGSRFMFRLPWRFGQF